MKKILSLLLALFLFTSEATAFPNGGGPAPVTSQILAAQRSMIANGLTQNTIITGRAMHYAHPAGAISNLRLVYAQWYYSTTTLQEVNAGNSALITASIEYPANVFTQVTFNNGSTSATIADGGDLESDPIRITIPTSGQFWVRTCYQPGGSLNIPITTTPNTAVALGLPEGASTAGDLTMGGTINQTPTANTIRPVAIIGDVAAVNAQAYILGGDSIDWGQADTDSVDAHGGSGYLARALVNKGSYTKFATQGQSVHDVVSNNTKLKALIALLDGHYTAIVTEYGYNDLRVYGNVPQLQSDLQTYWGLYTGRKYQSTYGPHTTSTDGWTTTGGQSQFTGGFWSADNLNSINNWIRTVPTGLDSVVEAGDAFMSGRNSDLWAAHTPGWTLDGAHPLTPAATSIGAAVSPAFP